MKLNFVPFCLPIFDLILINARNTYTLNEYDEEVPIRVKMYFDDENE